VEQDTVTGPFKNPDYDRFRIIIEEARTGRIITRDLEMSEQKFLRQLSGPCTITGKINPKSASVVDPDTGQPIRFKPWGHWAHVEKTIRGERKIVFSGLFKPSIPDPATGVLDAEFTGFSAYADEIPWLQNWNPIAVDPFEIFKRVWGHLQSYEHGNLGVEVFPLVSGTQMLPGFSFDGEDFILDFFAIFIRAIDFTDCGDYLNKLSRDIPIDYFERSSWNSDKSAVLRKIELAYPRGGVRQDFLSFQIGVNVETATPKTEAAIEWTSDVVIRGWFPGKVYSYELSNADPLRYRRTIVEEDAKINSDERAKAWAHRQLTRRQVPFYWEKITVKMYHSNAMFGDYDVGDSIRVQGEMPWVGFVDQWHKIIALAVDTDSNLVELSLRAEGAFTYDPIFYEGPEANLISNPSFVSNLSGWTAEGLWTRDATEGDVEPGSARITANGTVNNLISSPVPVTPGDELIPTVKAKWQSLVGTGNKVQLLVAEFDITGTPINLISVGELAATGTNATFTQITGTHRTVPSGIVQARLILRVPDNAISGDAWFDKPFLGKDS
jgi:hypothetical protein